MCTGVKIDYPQGCVLGRTMDLEMATDYNIIYQPRNYDCGDNLMKGHFKSKYRVLGIGFRDHDPLKDGINEHGLIGITNEFLTFHLHGCKPQKGYINLSSYHFMTYVLANYQSVAEFKEDADKIFLASHNIKGDSVITPGFQFMFADSQQDCVVVESDHGRLKYFDNPYNVVTNAPTFPSHVRNLEKTFDLNRLDDFNGAKNLPGGYDPKSRFIKAFYQSQQYKEAESSEEAFSQVYRVLSGVVLPKGFIFNNKFNENTYTAYTAAYDTQSKRLTVQAENNPTVYSLSFDDLADLDRRQAFFIQDTFQAQPLISQ